MRKLDLNNMSERSKIIFSVLYLGGVYVSKKIVDMSTPAVAHAMGYDKNDWTPCLLTGFFVIYGIGVLMTVCSPAEEITMRFFQEERPRDNAGWLKYRPAKAEDAMQAFYASKLKERGGKEGKLHFARQLQITSYIPTSEPDEISREPVRAMA